MKLKRRLASTPTHPSLLPGAFRCSPALSVTCPVTPGPTKCPEPLRALKGLPLTPWLLAPRQRALPRRHRYYELMRQSYALHRLWSQPRSAGLRRSLSAPAGHSTFPALLPRILPQMPGPLPRRSLWCAYSFLPTGLRPSPFPKWVGTPQNPVQRRQYGGCSRGCSHSLMFRPEGFARHPGRSHRSVAYGSSPAPPR